MGRPIKDLKGQRFGRLFVLERDITRPSGAGKSVYWKCICDCGKECSIRTDKLTNNITFSCGCFADEIRGQSTLLDLTDKTFGRLQVIERDNSKPSGKNKPAFWICKCDCGNYVSIRSDHLRNGTTTSCGCLNSKGEEKISKILQELNIKYKTQFEFNDLKGDYNNLRFDFAIYNKNNLLCLIEYQGEQHFKKWGAESEERFLKRIEYDNKKRIYCKDKNIPLLEIKFSDFDKLNNEFLLKMIECISGGKIE